MSTPTATELPDRSAFSATTHGMFDLLCDAKAHPQETVLKAAMAAGLADDYLRCIEEGRRARRGRPASLQEYAHSGARSFARNNLRLSVRNGRLELTDTPDGVMVTMPRQFAAKWAVVKRAHTRRQQREPVAVQPFGEVSYYAGIPEWEGWAYAPLVARDVAHVRPSVPVSLPVLEAAFPGWEVREAPDGLISVAAATGAPVKDVVAQWFAEQAIHHDGVRDAKNVRRRNLAELPIDFYSDLVAKSVPFARGLVGARYGASMQRLVGDYDDIDGYVTLWVLELAQSFDATLGRPFGTWITNQLPRKVQDLNRASHGRTASDAEMRHAKARAEFEGKFGRTPTEKELREVLGLTKEEMRAKRSHLTVLASLRSPTPLDSGPDAPEIQIADDRLTPDQIAEKEERSQQITLSLLAASGTYNPETGTPVITKPLGFLVTYLMMWDEWVKGDLIALAGCADRKVTDEVEVVHTALAKALSELRGGGL
jgi:DNA-directed RNA polymerase specialized sigma subunit